MAGGVTHVNVERVEPRVLLVTWRGEIDVVAFVSDSPDDAGTVIVDPAGPRMLRVVLDDEHHRPYIHLFVPEHGFVVAAERLVPLAGTYNFRDIGGYGTEDGRRVRWGRVYRSDHLADLQAAGIDQLHALGVGAVVDMRGPHEHAVAPSALTDEDPITRHDWPVGDGAEAGVPLGELVKKAKIEQYSAADMTALYVDLLEMHGEVFARVLALAAAAVAGASAVVYHCTAGKDRTGLVTALLLNLLGVDDATILDDFELTNRYRSQRRLEELRPELDERGVDIERFLPLFTAHRRSMADALAQTRDRHGSLEQYLVGHAGLDPSVPGELRRVLLTDGTGL